MVAAPAAVQNQPGSGGTFAAGLSFLGDDGRHGYDGRLRRADIKSTISGRARELVGDVSWNALACALRAH